MRNSGLNARTGRQHPFRRPHRQHHCIIAIVASLRPLTAQRRRPALGLTPGQADRVPHRPGGAMPLALRRGRGAVSGVPWVLLSRDKNGLTVEKVQSFSRLPVPKVIHLGLRRLRLRQAAPPPP